jgi:tetraacyldisaccharide 4'-kinase
MKVIRILLFPLSVLYDIITQVRNKLYDLGMKPSAKFDLPVIGIGNLAVGGTGKTPMTEHLIRLLASSHRVATLSRGYGRKTKGFRIAGVTDDASTLGDEPFQFYGKFHQQIIVAVGEERVMAIPNILHEFPETEIILLDDAYQHRKVSPSFQILITDYNNPFYEDYLMPAGRLRESRKGSNRADVIVVSKCPADISEDVMMRMEAAIREYVTKPVFFTKINYGVPVSLNDGERSLPKNVVLVSGIANAKPLNDHIKNHYGLIKHFDFPDHHHYAEHDLKEIVKFAREHNASVIVTEKDAVKLTSPALKSLVSEIPFFYLPISIEFIKSGEDFDEMVKNVVHRAL